MRAKTRIYVLILTNKPNKPSKPVRGIKKQKAPISRYLFAS